MTTPPVPRLEAAVALVIRHRVWLLALPTFAITAWVFWTFNRPLYFNPVGGYDEQFFIWGGWSITKGLAPYRDFLEYKPPILFLTHALAVAITDVRGPSFRLFFTFLCCGGFIVLQAAMITRRIHPLLALVAVTGIISIFVNATRHDSSICDAESVGLAYYCLGLAFLIVQSPWRRATEAIGAFFFVCVVLSKEPFAACVVASWATCFLFNYGHANWRTTFPGYFKRTMLGVAVALGLLAVWMVPTGAMASYLEMATAYFRMFRDPAKGYCVTLGRWKPGTPLENLVAQWAYIRRDLVNLPYVGLMAPAFGVACVALWRRSKVVLAAGFVTLAAGLYAVTATNCQWSHYYNMPLAGALCFAVLGLEAASREIEAAGRRAYAFVVVPLVVAMAVALYPRLEAESALKFTFRPPPEPITGVLQFIRENSTPADKLFTTGPPMLYVLADRVNAVKQSSIIDDLTYHYEGATVEERLKPIYDQLVKNQPKIVVLDPENGHRKGDHMRVVITPFLQQYGYRPVGPYYWVHP